MSDIYEILKKFWGYENFRPMQEDVIQSVLSGKDTLALLPTGGGKSICFQVPALAQEGICVVISPLIALMKDQVANLKKRGINAVAIYAGMSRREIDILLDNCIFGDIKFFYVSPERLTTELFLVRFQKMNVNLIAVDESHCISQWGYDFRPPYLQIPEIRQYFPDVPVIALTATATPEVVVDIQEKLEFKSQNVLQKSFERKNLIYVVQEEQDKHGRLLKIVHKLKGSGVVYVRNRRKTEEISMFLQQNGVYADFYHAGLDSKSRDQKQDAWINNKIRIIVATNAFGMGIDKPDVRFVVHLDLADSLEAYFQEAGRGGRDEKKAYAIQLYSNSDIVSFKEQVAKSFPSIQTIKKMYQALGSYFQLAVGSGKEELFNFNLGEFCNRYKTNTSQVLNALKYLEKEGYISVSEGVFEASKLKFVVHQGDLQQYQESNSTLANFIKVILRSYSGVFDNYKIISEDDIAKRCGISFTQAKNLLELLTKQKVIDYIPQNNDSKIYYNEERLSDQNLILSKKNYEERKKVAIERMDSVIHYVSHTEICRNQLLLSYFGERNTDTCGSCDICLKKKREADSNANFDEHCKSIRSLLEHPQPLDELITNIPQFPDQELIKTIRFLMDNDRIVQAGSKLYWNE